MVKPKNLFSPVQAALPNTAAGRTAKIQSSPAVWTDCAKVVRPVYDFRGLGPDRSPDVHFLALMTEVKKTLSGAETSVI